MSEQLRMTEGEWLLSADDVKAWGISALASLADYQLHTRRAGWYPRKPREARP